MKKNYFYALFASLMLFMAMPANAQISSMTDLYGKYKFTAKITLTDAGKAYADKFKEECEVVISEPTITGFLAEMSGFAGADGNMSIGEFDETACSFYVGGPNDYNYGAWDGYVAVANANAEWPYARYDIEGSTQFGMTFNFDPETKDITVGDFTIVCLAGAWSTYEAVKLADVKEVKMTILEDAGGNVVIPDIAGHWTFEGGLRQDTLSPKGFFMDLEAKDAALKEWKATIAFEGYEDNTITLDGTFDGILLTLPFDSVYLDGEKVRLGNKVAPSTAKQGNLYFSYATKSAMQLYENIYIRKDTVVNGTAGGTIVQVFNGYVTRENPNAIDWSGVYEVTIDEEGYREYEYAEENGISFPKTFNMTLEKTPTGYSITEFLGYKYGEDNNYAVNYAVVVNDDEVTATVAFEGYNNSMASLASLGNEDTNEDGFGDIYYYYGITNGTGNPGTVNLTLNEDGSIVIGDFMLMYWVYNYSETTNEYKPLVKVMNAVGVKKVYDWDGTYTLTANVATEEGVDATLFPAEFEVVLKKENDKYFVEKFMDTNIYETNQGNCEIVLSGDTKTATLSLDQAWGYFFVSGDYPNYITMNDKDGNATVVTAVMGDDKIVVAMDDFTLYSFNWTTNEASKLATYSNVVLTKKEVAASIENVTVENTAVKGIFDMQGRKIEAITAPGLYIIDGVKVLVK